MALAILCLVFAGICILEILIRLFGASSASDFTYFICRPFGIPFSMFVGFLVRIILLVLAGVAAYHGILFFIN